MGIIHYGRPLSDDARRACLYEGEPFILLATNEGEALCAHAQRMIEAAFAPLDPRTAQHELPVITRSGSSSGLGPIGPAPRR